MNPVAFVKKRIQTTKDIVNNLVCLAKTGSDCDKPRRNAIDQKVKDKTLEKQKEEYIKAHPEGYFKRERDMPGKRKMEKAIVKKAVKRIVSNTKKRSKPKAAAKKHVMAKPLSHHVTSSASWRHRSKHPKFSSGSGDGVVIEHTEYVDQLMTSTTFNVSNAYAVNPGQGGTFRILANVASSWERFRVRSVRFKFETLLGNQSNNQQVGEIISYIEYDSHQSVPTSKVQMLSEEYSLSTPGDEDQIITAVGTRRRGILGPSTEYQIRTGSPSGDILNYDPCYVVFAANGFPTANEVAGNIFVEYTIELYQMKIPTSINRAMNQMQVAYTLTIAQESAAAAAGGSIRDGQYLDDTGIFKGQTNSVVQGYDFVGYGAGTSVTVPPGYYAWWFPVGAHNVVYTALSLATVATCSRVIPAVISGTFPDPTLSGAAGVTLPALYAQPVQGSVTGDSLQITNSNGEAAIEGSPLYMYIKSFNTNVVGGGSTALGSICYCSTSFVVTRPGYVYFQPPTATGTTTATVYVMWTATTTNSGYNNGNADLERKKVADPLREFQDSRYKKLQVKVCEKGEEDSSSSSTDQWPDTPFHDEREAMRREVREEVLRNQKQFAHECQDTVVVGSRSNSRK